MAEKKAVFFDIDGTLWDQNSYIPESTKEAVRRLKENGHLVFICTGRSRALVHDPNLLSMEFDGIISGCGARIEYQGELLFNQNFDQEVVALAVDTFKKHGMTAIMEGNPCYYADLEEMKTHRMGPYLLKAAGDYIEEVSDHRGRWDAGKFLVFHNDQDPTPVVETLDEYMDFIISNKDAFEVVLKGFTKASGIKRICEMLDISLEDTYAFGDSPNDLEMLELVQTGVAMGNADEEVKQCADYVTDDLNQDGIYKACVHLGLI